MTRLRAAWLTSEAAQTVMAALSVEGARVCFVGGCVRNALLGAPVSDLDIATNARPEAVMRLAEAAGLKTVPTGIDHGTVTVLAGGVPFEVTTFRRDVSTDGRRATVAFSDSLEEDALRRDFTMNALYVGPDGEIVDPVGGLADLAIRRFRFIGEADQRIREDYLRILRLFRFHAQYGDQAAGLDPAALAAVARNRAGLAAISRERIRAELAKLLLTPDPMPAVRAMDDTGVLEEVLPGADTTVLARLIDVEGDAPPRWIRRLAALGGGDRSETLRLSRVEARAADTLASAEAGATDPAEVAYRAGADLGTDAALLALARGRDPGLDWPARVRRAASAVFPVAARDLSPTIPPGPALGEALRRLEARWIASDFSLERSDLLALAASVED